jgi:feruloyl esterase
VLNYTGLDYAAVVYGVTQGFATVASNNGHNGTSGLSFYRSPGVLEDFAHRS